mmetsp:Transcript_33359/g.69778  ORF Transcript_33359/g.69778 Transcript_33359/m.69778 type:complete len:637 (+) Transcript_33359:118-2028(+)
MMTMAEKEAATAQVIKISTTVSCCLFGLMGFLCCLSIFMPWWEGASSGSMISTPAGTDRKVAEATISLWAYDLKVEVGSVDDEGGVTEQAESSTWDTMCSLAAEETKESPPECAQVATIRAFTILPMLFAFFAVVPILLAKKISPLLLVIGAALGMAADFFAFLGMIIGVMLSTSGLGGMGFLCLLIGWLLGMVAIASTLFTAGKAMPPDHLPGAPVEVKVNREDKAEAARKKAAKEALELAKKFGGPRGDRSDDGSARSSHSGGSQAQAAPQEKAPVMLQKVLFWSEEHNEDEPVPTELLELAYREIDTDDSGTILLEELVAGLAKCGLNASPAAMESVMLEIDKNSDGTVDIHEFVEFFRRIEELSQFNKKSQQRAQFLVVVCNCCFLFHIIVVGVMLMLFIKMDPGEDPDTYMIMQNGLMVFCVDLGILFCCVILIPAGRLTIGSNVKAWNAHYEAAMAARRSVKPVSSGNTSGPGPRGPAWAAGGVSVAPPAVNAAMYGASYRVNKFQLQDANPFDVEMPQDTLGTFQSTQGSNMHGNQFGSTRGSQISYASGVSSGKRSSVKADPGVILSKTGEFLRYDPSQYRLAAMMCIENGAPASFTPMQVQNINMPHPFDREEAGGPPGVPANDEFG